MSILQQLMETKELTEMFFDLPNDDLIKVYSQGKWNIKNILIHLADAESILHERVKRIIAEPKQVIWAFDQDLWCKNLDYDAFPIELGKSLYSANRSSILYLANKFYDRMGDREFVHSQTGIRTLKDEFDKIAHHNRAHLDQIETALKLF